MRKQKPMASITTFKGAVSIFRKFVYYCMCVSVTLYKLGKRNFKTYLILFFLFDAKKMFYLCVICIFRHFSIIDRGES